MQREASLFFVVKQRLYMTGMLYSWKSFHFDTPEYELRHDLDYIDVTRISDDVKVGFCPTRIFRQI